MKCNPFRRREHKNRPPSAKKSGGATDRWEGGLRALPGSRTVPRTVYWPRERRSFTSHDAMKPPAPVTHTLFAAGAAIAFWFSATADEENCRSRVVDDRLQSRAFWCCNCNCFFILFHELRKKQLFILKKIKLNLNGTLGKVDWFF